MADINLLPEELRPSKKLIWYRLRPYLALAFIFLAIFSSYFYLMVQSRALERELKEIEKQVAINKTGEQTALEEEKRLQSLREKKNELEQLAKDRMRWSQFLSVLNDTVPQDVWLTKIEKSPENKLRITGHSANFKSVGDFFLALKDFAVLENVKLESVHEVSSRESVLEFSITADLKTVSSGENKSQ